MDRFDCITIMMTKRQNYLISISVFIIHVFRNRILKIWLLFSYIFWKYNFSRCIFKTDIPKFNYKFLDYFLKYFEHIFIFSHEL